MKCVPAIFLIALAWAGVGVAAADPKDYLDRPAAWFAADEAGRIAANILSFQSALGGWPKNVDTTENSYQGDREDLDPTYDNGATTDELRFLARVYAATNDPVYQAAFDLGLDYILEYVFEVKAVEVDLTYSRQPATVALTIHPPYGLIALWAGLGLALVGLMVASGAAIRRRRAFQQEQQARLWAQEQLNLELEEELQTAHDLQMGLMPTGSPQVEGLDIAGRCLPANHVGGDYFQYFERDGKLLLCMADATGHAMGAAVPVMMFSGILESEIKHDHTLEALYANLNQILHNKLDPRTYICFAMGELDVVDYSLRLADSGCPYPFHYRAATGAVEEIQIDAYPLGVQPDTAYEVRETGLAAGDYIVFCSDGIVEAADGAGAIFGFEPTMAAIGAGCTEGLSAEALIDRLIGAVQAFADDEPQGDDMTCVVLRVE